MLLGNVWYEVDSKYSRTKALVHKKDLGITKKEKTLGLNAGIPC